MPAKDQYDEKARDICPFTHPLHRLEPECEGCLGISTALRCAHAAGKAEGREESEDWRDEGRALLQAIADGALSARPPQEQLVAIRIAAIRFFAQHARSIPQPAPAKGEKPCQHRSLVLTPDKEPQCYDCKLIGKKIFLSVAINHECPAPICSGQPCKWDGKNYAAPPSAPKEKP
jgi:hypothetical protein